MNKKILLIFPGKVMGWEARPKRPIPMSLLCVAAPLVEAGYEVEIIDQRVDPKWKSVLEEELQKDPICVGITSMTGPQLKYALEASKVVKEHTESPVVWGGVHATLLPNQTLDNEFIDIIVVEEGEATFLELVQALETKSPLSEVKGLWYKENGQKKNTGLRNLLNVNEQSPIPYHLVDLNKYTRMLFGIEHIDFFTSIGCPRKCAFCYSTSFHKQKWRAMDPEIAVNRITDFVKKHDVKGIYFTDSNFFFDIDRGRKILQGLVDENLDIIISSLNIDFLTLIKMNDDDFKLLEKVRCKRLPIAVETGSKRIQKLIRKPIDIQKLHDLNRRLRNYDMAFQFSFMMGFPTETKEELAETINLALRLLEVNSKADASFNIYTPFPGTELFEMALKHGLRFPEKIEDWYAFTYRNPPQGAAWLSEEMRRLVEVMDFCTFFMGRRPFRKPYEKVSPVVSFFSKIYAPIAQQRLKHLWIGFPIEVKLAKILGLYASQN